MIVYGLLIPLAVLDAAAMGYFSLQSTINQNWPTFILLAITNVAPLWALISKYSRNLIFDELLFNSCLMGSYLLTVSLLDISHDFSLVNWLGILIAFIGFILMKISWEKKKETGCSTH